MYITKKGQYALFFMIELALNKGRPVTVKQAAKKYDLSEKYLEQIATQLGRMRLVNVKRGCSGGYYLTKDSKDFSVKSIISTVEGERSSVDVKLDQTTDNNRVLGMIVSNIGNQLDHAVDDVLANTSLEDLITSYQNQLKYAYVI